MTTKTQVYGLHAVQALLQQQPDRIQRLIILKDRQDKKVQELIQLAQEQEIPVESAPRHELDRMAQGENHQGVIALCQSAKSLSESDIPALIENISGPALFLILDGVQDPHNLGACLRSADAAGVHAVIAPKDKSVGITPVVAKVACGAAETVPFIQVTNLARTISILQEHNIWVYGAAADAEQNLYQATFSGSVAIVLGAEGTGLRRLTQDRCDVLLNIPMQGSVSSLNVSVATGVFLFEVLRQRMVKK